MAKITQTFSCAGCDYKTTKWVGCCPSCKEWNTMSEEQESPVLVARKKSPLSRSASMVDLAQVALKPSERMKSHIKEWDRVMGGGIMPGSLVILTGDPGIGKSTLLLQVTRKLADRHRVFYFSCEESLEQVKQRAERIDALHANLLFSDQAYLDTIITTAQEQKPELIVIDSIQNCYTGDMDSLPGSTGQLKESAFRLMRLAKEYNIAILMTAHITKDGIMAGPKTLEHMVDAVFYLHGEDRWQTRVLRSVKNRFGTVNEIGFFEMQEHGLQEVPNINQQLLEEVSYSPGSVLISYIEGTRPLLIELQALTISSKFGMPQRVVSGTDQTQVVLIAAILEKYLKIPLSGQDIFFKISGGFKIKGSSIDLGIALALLSSYFQKPLPEKCVALGEISLTGAIKPINHINLHLAEAEKFGINQLFIARNQKAVTTSCKLQHFYNVYELVTLFE